MRFMFFAVILGMVPVGATAQETANENAPMIVSGCIEKGVEAGCLVLNAQGVLYNVTNARPRPTPGAYGHVTGTESNEFSHCMQGVLLDHATWEQDKRMTCARKNR